jgi:dolichol-phosphate mannosyltransferase
MPPMRLFGNAVLSLMTKLSSGYWDLFDPTNGYTAIHADAARYLPFHKISRRYFFETDMLFRLNTLGAVVVDVPMDAHYGDEVSNLKISKIVTEFLGKHMRATSASGSSTTTTCATCRWPRSSCRWAWACFAGSVYGLFHWAGSARAGVATPAGTVMAWRRCR